MSRAACRYGFSTCAFRGVQAVCAGCQGGSNYEELYREPKKRKTKTPPPSAPTSKSDEKLA